MSPVHPDGRVALARGGDAQAFNQLVEGSQRLCFHIARSRLDDAESAQDACQDALLRAWQAMDRFQGDEEAFRRWLVRIVINQCHDRLRALGRRGRDLSLDGGPETDEPAPLLPAPDESPEAYTLRSDLGALLAHCLNRLTDEHRTVILLDQAGFSYAEMAEVLEVEPGTVKSRLSRARLRAREILRGEPDGAPGRWSGRSAAAPPPGAADRGASS
ncbi:MAG: RNA polymerase sigma factor [Anaerolineae bacterium]|jgi:RNA polymerase sigma-70 factor (ECF subfamily)